MKTGLKKNVVFTSAYDSFEFALAIYMTQIHTCIRDHLVKHSDQVSTNVTSRAFIKFTTDLKLWPSFCPSLTQFQVWPTDHQNKYPEKISSTLSKTMCPLYAKENQRTIGSSSQHAQPTYVPRLMCFISLLTDLSNNMRKAIQPHFFVMGEYRILQEK